MKTRVTKWGNSLAVRIPQPVAEEAHLRDGDTIEFDVTRSGLVTLRPKKSLPSLDEMVSQINSDNLHVETDWGKPEGKEIW